jgi:TonB-linked SusC/RagA family outer membrane protein
MRRRMVFVGVSAVFLSTAKAQATGPHFASATSVTSATDILAFQSAAVFQQRIALDVRDVPVARAIDEIARRAHVQISFSPSLLSGTVPVSLSSESITVGAALESVLAGTGIGLAVAADGVNIVLMPPGDRGAVSLTHQLAGGTIQGHVSDSASGQPLAQVQIHVEHTTVGAITGGDGHFAIHSVPAGTYRVIAQRLGFTPAAQTVTVVADSAVTVNFTIAASPTILNQVVTTALGDQRRYEIGNAISSIGVDSLAAAAPVTSVSDIISARAPGVEVMESNGEVGSGPALRIRGQGSLVVAGDPIIIVDGVRLDNTSGGIVPPLFGGASPSPSRINDIDFSDVATIDILKGPSAATEYGTDAANGVIVIKTKHATTSGPPRWNIQAEQSVSQVGTTFPNTYYSFGHTTGANPQPVNCPLVPSVETSDVGSTVGSCKVDSVVAWTPLNHAATTMFGLGNRERADVSVTGGSDGLRYYVGGSLTNEVGTLKTPTIFNGLADSINLPNANRRPNSNDQRSIRGNSAIKLTSNADMQVSAAYMSTNFFAPDSPNLYEGVYTSYALNTPQNYYGWGSATGTPVFEYGETNQQNTDRFTGSLTTNWTPFHWLSAHLTGGLDHGSQVLTSTILPQEHALYAGYPGELGISNGTTDIYTVDFRTAATAQLTKSVRSLTSVGVQLVDNRQEATYAQSTNTSLTNPTLTGATSLSTIQTGTRQATLGGYIEEQIGLWDRLYLTGALRIDDGSGFGSGYSSVTYPKASVSWLALTDGANTLRLRGAFGESGIQPPNGAAQELFTSVLGYYNGAQVGEGSIINGANPGLQPERTSEFEGGFDVGFGHGRVELGFTAYTKTTNDALVPVGTGWELGGINSYENIGEVRNYGFEGNLSATILRSRNVTWDVGFNGSINKNNLVKLAPGLQPQKMIGDHAVFRFAPGTPLYGNAAPKEHWTDANHDGIVEYSEVSVEDSLSYAGSSQPTRMASLTTHLALFHGTVTIGSLFDYRGGFRLMNTTAFHDATYVQSDFASNDAHAPVWEQLRDVATNLAFNTGLNANAPTIGYYEDASYVRWRELSLTFSLSPKLAHLAHVRSLSLTGAIRNLALITPWTGGDPEVTSSEGGNVSTQPTTGQLVVGRDLREGAQPIPLSRYFVLRLNAGF